MDESVESNQRIFTALQCLVRSLAHSVRGDLSVVTNELSYLATIAPNEDLSSAVGRCQSIASTLGVLQFFRDCPLVMQKVTVQKLASHLSTRCTVAYGEDETTIKIDANLFTRVFTVVVDTVFRTSETMQLWVRVGKISDHCLGVEVSDSVQSDPFTRAPDSLLSAAVNAYGESVLPALAVGEVLLALMNIKCSASLRVDASGGSLLLFECPLE